MTQEDSRQPNDTIWNAYPALHAARRWSEQLVGRIRLRLSGLEAQFPAVCCVVLSGSLARLDACPQSDVDLIVVLDDDTGLDSEQAVGALTATWERLSPLGLRGSQIRGVFGSPTSRRQLCDGPRGIVNEPVDVFGKRIQLLLEARAVLGHQACTRLQSEILLRYSRHPFAGRPGEYWGYLLDDLMRYWRSYRIWRHWDITSGNGGWYLRNLKLRYSRLLTYASLLLACAVCEPTSSDALLPVLNLTPLERLRQVDQRVGAGAFEVIGGHYDRFLQVVNDATRRQELERATPTEPALALPSAPEGFIELLEDADELRMELLRLLHGLPSSQRDCVLSRLIF